MAPRPAAGETTTRRTRWLAAGLLLFLAMAAVADAPRDEFRRAYENYSASAEAGKYRDARKHAQRAYELGEQLFAEDSEELAALSYNYGQMSLIGAGRRTEERAVAAEILAEALSRFETVYGKQAPDLIPVLMDLGTARADFGSAGPQRRQYDRALKIAASHYGKDSRRYAELLTQAGSRILTDARSPTSKKYLERGYETMRSIAGPEDPATGYAAFWLGKYKMTGRHYKEAETYLSAALATFAEPDNPENQVELTTHAFLVEVYEELGRSADATRHCQAIGRMSPVSANQNYLPLFKRAPVYPVRAREMGQSGWVIVSFTVDEEGIVRNPEVVETHGADMFRTAALKAASRFRYAPRFIDGLPVATPDVLHRISFEIQ